MAFIVFLPLTIGIALVFSHDLQAGLLYTTAQSINWLLGAASYFLLPSLGPVYAYPGDFAGLPVSEVTRLQGILLDQRLDFLRDPASGTPQSIAGFASLHISMSFTAALAAQLLGASRPLRIALWIWFAVTLANTVYLGWHYFLDDVGGVILGATALVLAAALTGIDLRKARARRRATVPFAEWDDEPLAPRLPEPAAAAVARPEREPLRSTAASRARGAPRPMRDARACSVSGRDVVHVVPLVDVQGQQLPALDELWVGAGRCTCASNRNQRGPTTACASMIPEDSSSNVS